MSITSKIPKCLVGKMWGRKVRGVLELHCLECDQGWAIRKPLTGDGAHPGNLLHLLNHAAGHDQSPEEKEAWKREQLEAASRYNANA